VKRAVSLAEPLTLKSPHWAYTFAYLAVTFAIGLLLCSFIVAGARPAQMALIAQGLSLPIAVATAAAGLLIIAPLKRMQIRSVRILIIRSALAFAIVGAAWPAAAFVSAVLTLGWNAALIEARHLPLLAPVGAGIGAVSGAAGGTLARAACIKRRV
jgi:hypothetical protein